LVWEEARTPEGRRNRVALRKKVAKQ